MSTYDPQPPETIIALQAARIAALEKQLREAVDLARITEREVRAILAGCGDTDEQMRASVPLTNLRGHLENTETRGTGNAAAGAEGGAAESVSHPPAMLTKEAARSPLSDEQMAEVERGITERNLCVVYPLKKRAFASGRLPPRGGSAA